MGEGRKTDDDEEVEEDEERNEEGQGWDLKFRRDSRRFCGVNVVGGYDHISLHTGMKFSKIFLSIKMNKIKNISIYSA